MKTLPFLLLAILAVCCCGCAVTGSGVSSKLSREELADARKRRVLLPDMTPQEVLRIWPKPDGVSASGRQEKWTYRLGRRATGYDINATVTFTNGRLSEVVNGDIMSRVAKASGPGANIFLQ